MDAPAKPRIAVIGSCQVGGMSKMAAQMLPGADITFHCVGVSRKFPELVAALPRFDLIVSQVADTSRFEELRLCRLQDAGLPVTFVPTLVFGGFHPDSVLSAFPGTAAIAGIDNGVHSAIAMAGYGLGLAPARVAKLYNAFVFAHLGYIDAFAGERAALIETYRAAGYDVAQMFDRWVSDLGPFMYTFNHAKIEVLADLIRMALVKAAFLDPSAPLPGAMADPAAEYCILPIFPSLARRLGVPGSASFLRAAWAVPPGESREVSMLDFVSACFEKYRVAASGTMFQQPRIARIRDRLASLLADG